MRITIHSFYETWFTSDKTLLAFLGMRYGIPAMAIQSSLSRMWSGIPRPNIRHRSYSYLAA